MPKLKKRKENKKFFSTNSGYHNDSANPTQGVTFFSISNSPFELDIIKLIIESLHEKMKLWFLREFSWKKEICQKPTFFAFQTIRLPTPGTRVILLIKLVHQN